MPNRVIWNSRSHQPKAQDEALAANESYSLGQGIFMAKAYLAAVSLICRMKFVPSQNLDLYPLVQKDKRLGIRSAVNHVTLHRNTVRIGSSLAFAKVDRRLSRLFFKAPGRNIQSF
jgi:hypothetical protein